MSELARPLADAAERLFARACSVDVVNRAEAGERPQALWQALQDLAPTQLLIAEGRGGAGGDWLDACLLLERAGEFNVPLPIAETLLGAWLLDQAGVAAPEGPTSFACADADFAPLAQSGRITLNLPRVPWGDACPQLVIAARYGDATGVLCVPRAAFTVTPGRALSGEPRDDVAVVELDVERAGVALRRVGSLSVLECLSRAALLRAALIAGACRCVLALTLQHTADRVQFGRAVGEFQAVQHQLAQLAEEAAAARVAVHAAATTVDPRWCVAANAAAKVRAGEAAGLAVRIAHQLHGAIGVTLEHALQQSTRRLLTWRDEHGAEAFWARELVAQFRRDHRGDARGAWPAVVAATTR